MHFFKKITLLLSTLFFTTQCTTVSYQETREPAAYYKNSKKNQFSTPIPPLSEKDWLSELPGSADTYLDFVKTTLKSKNKYNLKPHDLLRAATRISKYLGFIMLNYKTKLDEHRVAEKTLNRILDSSTQFLFCSDLKDYECIEGIPILPPLATEKQEDIKLKLGEQVQIQSSLEENMDWYFNQQIFTPEDEYNENKGVARHLEKLIDSVDTANKDHALFMALYGMDDISKNSSQPGSLETIYSKIINLHKSGTPVYGVFDHMGPHPRSERPLIMSYVKPQGKESLRWVFSPLNEKKETTSSAKNQQQLSKNVTAESDEDYDQLTNLKFQYPEGTLGLISQLSEGAKSDEDAQGRLEWKNSGIMHNKFFIFKKQNNWSVWTGTANISRTCLGTERNSNLSVHIKNNEIAKAYYDEFQEMYTFKKTSYSLKEIDPLVVGNDSKTFPYGRFHQAKRPNTKRLFYFAKDQTTARLYFSPTDDAEHRALLPMIHSAKAGDRLLISMFGGAGIEYVRAFQWAAARGVEIQILLDAPTGCGPGAWAGKSGDATLLTENPYLKLSQNFHPIELRKNDKGVKQTWKQNHQKIGLLLRKKTKENYIAEMLTFGSQNWSNNGNDDNDENLLILSKENESLKIGLDFQDHFENFLWPKSLEITEKEGCTATTTTTAD